MFICQKVPPSEKTCIYHHLILQNKIKKSQISQLVTEEGVKISQKECHEYLEKEVRYLLSNPHCGDEESINDMLNEIEVCVTKEDNELLMKVPEIAEIKEVIQNSNLQSSPGHDGIPVLFYLVCWFIVGDTLTEVIKEIHKGCFPTYSQNE